VELTLLRGDQCSIAGLRKVTWSAYQIGIGLVVVSWQVRPA